MRRIFCLSQRHAQLVWIVIVNHTYDQVIQACAVNKTISQITDQDNIIVIDKEVTAAQTQFKKLNNSTMRSALLFEKCTALYTQMFEQVNSQHDWVNIKDLHLKDNYTRYRMNAGNYTMLWKSLSDWATKQWDALTVQYTKRSATLRWQSHARFMTTQLPPGFDGKNFKAYSLCESG